MKNISIPLITELKQAVIDRNKLPKLSITDRETLSDNYQAHVDIQHKLDELREKILRAEVQYTLKHNMV